MGCPLDLGVAEIPFFLTVRDGGGGRCEQGFFVQGNPEQTKAQALWPFVLKTCSGLPRVCLTQTPCGGEGGHLCFLRSRGGTAGEASAQSTSEWATLGARAAVSTERGDAENTHLRSRRPGTRNR